MEILIKVAQLFLSLSILVLIHEFGHFLFAKIFKTRVEKFYLFFNAGFSLFKFKKGETEYGIGWLPLGGYVKIAGMIDESMDKEQLKQEPQPYEFRSKKSWQRLLIMIGGVMFNLILALVIYSSIMFVWGKQYLPTENAKYGIVCDSLALDAGIRDGDKILSVDQQKVEDFDKIVTTILLNEAKTIQVERNGIQETIHLPEDIIQKLLKRKKEDGDFLAPRIPFIVEEFAKKSAAKDAGIKKGDQIIGFNNSNIKYFDQIRDSLSYYKGQKITLSILRNNDTLEIVSAISEEGMLGVALAGYSKYFELKKFEYTFFEAIPAGIKEGIRSIGDYFKQLKIIFNPKTKAYESVGGFIAIGKIFPSIWNWQAFWKLTALLSIMLGILNLLPIPALDGGHVMFLLYEIITGRKPSDKFLERAQIVGMIILLALVAYANGNDIVKLFTK